MNASERREPHGDTIYAALKRDILQGVLAPGAPLREVHLGRSHQVSRTPVREALSRLEAEGLVTRQSRSGLVVSAPTLDEIIDLYVVREALEGVAARLAAERRTELDLARLEMLVGAHAREVEAGSMEREKHFSAEFHAQIWRIAGNRPLRRAIDELHAAVQRIQPNTLTYPGRSHASLREHQQLLEAIRARDADAAERIASEHVRQVRATRISLSIEAEQAATGE